jgi:chaperonin GroES
MKRRIMRPIGDRIVVEQFPEQVRTLGGLEIPDQAKEKPLEGVVRFVGPGRYEPGVGLFPCTVVEGDRVLFAKYTGSKVKLDGEELLVLRQDEILMVDTGKVVEDEETKDGRVYFSKIHEPEEVEPNPGGFLSNGDPLPDPDALGPDDIDQKETE